MDRCGMPLKVRSCMQSTRPLVRARAHLPGCRSRVSIAQFTDGTLLASTLQAVRAEDGATQWCAFAYRQKDRGALELVAEGAGGAAAITATIGAESALGRGRLAKVVHYVFVRLQRGAGTTKETRFCLLTVVPESISGLGKAVVVPHKGAVTAIFSPFTAHVELTSVAELTQEALVKHANFYVDWRD
eukprot:g5044.t1